MKLLKYISPVFMVMAVINIAHANTDKLVLVKAKIFFKIATYDSALPKNHVKIGIVYPQSDNSHGPMAENAFKSLSGMKVNGRTIEIKRVTYKSVREIARQIKEFSPYGLYVVGSVPDKDINIVSDIAKTNKIFTFADNADQVPLGLAAGIDLSGSTRQITLNMPVALESGRKLSGNFVKVCKIIK